jgi:hypothetical protein
MHKIFKGQIKVFKKMAHIQLVLKNNSVIKTMPFSETGFDRQHMLMHYSG